MKKLLILSLTLILLAPAVQGRKKQPKAGKVTDNVFHDDKYGFDLILHQDWKAKVGKDKDHLRLRLIQRKYDVPSDYINAPDYTKIPTLTVYVDTSSFGAHVFLDSLINEEFKSDQKKDILKEFEILNERELIPKRRSRIEIGGESALIWKAQAKYTKEVAESASSSTYKWVKRSYGGAIAVLKHGDYIVLFHVITEWEFFEPVLVEVMPMIQSIAFPEDEE